MGDRDTERQNVFSINTLVFTVVQHREQHRRTIAGRIGTEGIIGNPWDTADREEIRRLIVTDFDAVLIAVFCNDAVVVLDEAIKIRVIFDPDIAEGLIILMENSVVWVNDIPNGRVSLLIGEHFHAVQTIDGH